MTCVKRNAPFVLDDHFKIIKSSLKQNEFQKDDEKRKSPEVEEKNGKSNGRNSGDDASDASDKDD